ncbi:MAG TPA: hypothetical protein VHN79_11040 [Lacunisphaera sp.]|nr:hypothetical protein [Lacunisphaera sp.]
MRLLAIFTLLAATLAASAAAPKAAEIARSPLGLLITGWDGGAGRCSITLKNIGTSTTKFEYNELRGVVEQSGAIEVPVNVVFGQSRKEVASYYLEPGESRRFHVVFPGGRRIAGLSWKGTEQWDVLARGGIVDSPEAAIAKYREIEAKAKLAQRKKSSKAAAGALVSK